MASIPFTNNYTDLSSQRGFQFKFNCQKCGNGYMSTFQASKLGTAAGKTSNKFRNLLGGAGENAKKAKTELDSFLGGLEKQLATLEIKQIELRTGPQGALAASLDRELQTFKEKLRANQLPIPKGLEEFFQNLKSRILAANEELTRTTFEMERLDAIGQAMSQDSAEWLNVGDDLEKARKDAEDLAKQLAQLSLDIYTRGSEHAAQRGIIVADTKFEFGLFDGEVILIDPWVGQNPACPEDAQAFERIDAILITHGHFDHMGDAVELAK